MIILITYDVNTSDKIGAKRLRKVAKVCKNYGQRVQNSVFECEVSEAQLCILKDILSNIIKASTDSIGIYHLSSNMKNNTIVLGQETAFDVNGPLVI